ncbi:MAG: NADPH-dependent FMN reductase [Alphaproteobacteria bacterium]
MKKIIAFAASTSTTSINKQLAAYAASLIENVDIEVLDLNNFDMPIFSEDLERELGSPPKAIAFKQKLKEADAYIISIAEHNGNFTAAFKNLYDWVSRIEQNIFDNKKILLLSTSPGAGGGVRALEIAKLSFPFAHGVIAGEFSLPLFHVYFKTGKIEDKDIYEQLSEQIQLLVDGI